MKNRMRELNIKLTELSEYIKVSRPTLYKYIESYENGDLKSIPDKVVGLFRKMDDPDATKEQVVAFAITSFSESDTADPRDVVRRYLADTDSSPTKIEFMHRIVTTDGLDDLIPYLNGCLEILEEGCDSDEKAYQVARLLILKSKVTRNVPLKEEELNEAKEILRGLHGH